MNINIGDTVEIKFTAKNGQKVRLAGLVHGKTYAYGHDQYLIKEYKGLDPIKVRNVKKIK